VTQPRTLLLIRHGEKPAKGDQGVDEQGRSHQDGLLPKGWERAGALVALFAPNAVTLQSALPSPCALICPRYTGPVHRSHLTLLPLSQRLGITIQSEHPVDAHPAKVARSLLAIESAVVLMCWEHEHLVNIAGAVAVAVPMANPADVPTFWPDDRFDLIWRFDRGERTLSWTFASLDQQLLAGDLFPGESRP